jgi:hypothetical protein
MLNFNIFLNSKNPHVKRIHKINKDLPLWFIEGENSWIYSSYFKVALLRQYPSRTFIKVSFAGLFYYIFFEILIYILKGN